MKNKIIPNNNDMRFEVTTRCNYNCVICPRDKLTRKIETMSLEIFKSLFDKITNETDQYTNLTFPGMGEPLLDNTLEKKIEYAKSRKKNLSILILSNGSLLTPEKFKSLEDIGVTSIRVSCYGNDEESYFKVHRVKKAFSKVKDNLLRICQNKKQAQLLLTFNVVEGLNSDIVEDWINFWKNKADLIEVWRPHNWVNACDYRQIQKQKLNTCGRPFNGPLQIQVDGTVNMCCFDFDGRLTLGDLKTQSLKQIFSAPVFRKILRCHRSGNFSGSRLICSGCDQRNSEKNDVMSYNSKFNISERIKMISTTYEKVIS